MDPRKILLHNLSTHWIQRLPLNSWFTFSWAFLLMLTVLGTYRSPFYLLVLSALPDLRFSFSSKPAYSVKPVFPRDSPTLPFTFVVLSFAFSLVRSFVLCWPSATFVPLFACGKVLFWYFEVVLEDQHLP